MSTLTVTATGQVTLRRELLKHLGVQPGEKIAITAFSAESESRGQWGDSVTA